MQNRSCVQSEEIFNTVRDVLVERLLALGFASSHNKVGIALAGTVRAYTVTMSLLW